MLGTTVALGTKTGLSMDQLIGGIDMIMAIS